jgi:hypothetical protein
MPTKSVLSLVGDALGELEPTASLVDTPRAWLHENINQIIKIISDFSDTHGVRAGLANFGLIYPVGFYLFE